MNLKYENSVYIIESTIEEKDIAKEAGAYWHSTTSDWCKNDKCLMCRSGYKELRTWWTPRDEVALNLKEYADEETTKRLREIKKQ